MTRRWLPTLLLLATLPSCDGDPPTPAGDPVETLVAQLKAAAPGLEVEPEAVAAVAREGRGDYLVYLGRRPDLSAARGMEWKARGRYVAERLQQAAAEAQAPVRERLDARGTSYRAFWIDNVLSVRGSDLKTLQDVAAVPGVAALRAPRLLGLVEPEVRGESAAGGASPAAVDGVEPGLDHVRAPGAWALGLQGEGIVVANVDTGVRHTHETLSGAYRGARGDGTFQHDGNWWDPYAGSPVPLDDHGHGTHTMGTMVGRDAAGLNRIGMAPGARWIACRGCTSGGCGETELLECAQWIAAPWDLARQQPNPDLRPHVVNNSWGDCGTAYDGWYQGVIDAWHAAGIYPVFANGNASNCGYAQPPGCGTVGNPGRYGNVTGVGSTGTSNGLYASHSNWGPTDDPDTLNARGAPTLKPQVVAPGVDVRSALGDGDQSYAAWSGTSMSTPHVTGLVALVWQAAPCLQGEYVLTETLLEQSATPLPYASACGGEGPGEVPNMATGWGEIDALAAVQQAAGWCGPSGTVEGTVTDPSGRPVAGAMLSAGSRTGRSAEDGSFVLTWVPAGDQVLAATHFWHLDAAVAVTVLEGQTVRQDVVMTPRPAVRARGTVRDGGGHGWPLYARVTFTSPDGTARTVFTDPFTGAFETDLVEGATFGARVEPRVPGYGTRVEPVTADGTGGTLDLALDPVLCGAPGYARTPVARWDFEADGGGFSVDGDAGWAWGTPLLGPGSAHGGTGAWGIGLQAEFSADADTRLVSPPLDLSGPAGTTFELSWWQHLQTSFWSGDASVEASRDSGATWTVVWGPANGTVDSGWGRRALTLDDTWAVPGVRLRFRLQNSSFFFPEEARWYVDDVDLYRSGCQVLPGGLVAGLVSSSADGGGLAEVRVEAAGGSAMASLATPDDGALPDGFYAVFSPGPEAALAARKFGYRAAAAQVAVVPDGLVRQDLSLDEAQRAQLSGTVRDGAGHGWPLYARVRFQPPDGLPAVDAWTDPWTGRWAAEVLEGHAWPVEVQAVLPGYEIRKAEVVADGAAGDLDFALASPDCRAAGYRRPTLYRQDFEDGDGGWAAGGTTSWARGAPTSGPGGAHSGTWAWGTNPAGTYGPGEDGFVASPAIDLSAAAGQGVVLSWWQALQTEAGYDFARVDASPDGGATWSAVWGPRSGEVSADWQEVAVTLPPEYATAAFRVRFHLSSDDSVQAAGWSLDDVALSLRSCEALPAGVLAGFVQSAATEEGLTGARVELPGGGTTVSEDTAEDPAWPDGIYLAVVPPGTGRVAARLAGYGTARIPVTVAPDAATRADLVLGPPGVPVEGGGQVLDQGSHRWPLYARVSVRDPQGAEVLSTFTDPFDGTWVARLPEGVTYTVKAEPVLPGFQARARHVLVDGPLWSGDLDLESPFCDTPGYAPRAFLRAGFEEGDDGFTVDGTGSWQRGRPALGPGTAHGGEAAWATGLRDGYRDGEDARLLSPVVDLSAAPGTVRLSWWHHLDTVGAGDTATVEASRNGGATWDLVWGPASGQATTGWTRADVVLGPTWATPAFRVRFRLRSDAGGTAPGWMVDDVALEATACTALPGGLATGFVSDLSTGEGLPGASVEAGDRAGEALATPGDPAWPDGYYAAFGYAGGRAVTATLTGYAPGRAEVLLPEDGLLRLDLALGSARLSLDPPEVSARLLAGQAGQAVLRLANAGSAGAAWTVREADGAGVEGDVPWLQALPPDGTLSAAGSLDLVLGLDAALSGPGRHHARVRVPGDPSPHAAPEASVLLEVGHAIVIVPPEHGAVEPPGMDFVGHGEAASFAFRPEPGWHVRSVRVDGLDHGRTAGWTFQDVRESHVLEVVFEPDCRSDLDCPGAGDCLGACVGDTCDAALPKTSGTPCGDRRTTACTDPDTCDGAGACEANTHPAGLACRPASGPCDLPEACDGRSDDCPLDGRVADGGACDDGDPCTAGDACSAGGACAGLPRACDGLPPRPSCDDGATSRLWQPGAACDPATGDCAFAARLRACPDGCLAETGLCAGDGDPGCGDRAGGCITDGWPVWDPDLQAVACQRVLADDGTACDDGDPCTDGDRCDGRGACAGDPLPGCPPEPDPEPVPEAPEPLPDPAPDAVEPDLPPADLPRDLPGDAGGDDAGGDDLPADAGGDTAPPDPGDDPGTGPDDPAGDAAPDLPPDLPADAGGDAALPDPGEGDPAPLDPGPADEGPGGDPDPGAPDAAGGDDVPPAADGGPDPAAADAGTDLPGGDDRPGTRGGGCASGPAGALPGPALLLAALALLRRRWRRT